MVIKYRFNIIINSGSDKTTRNDICFQLRVFLKYFYFSKFFDTAKIDILELVELLSLLHGTKTIVNSLVSLLLKISKMPSSKVRVLKIKNNLIFKFKLYSRIKSWLKVDLNNAIGSPRVIFPLIYFGSLWISVIVEIGIIQLNNGPQKWVLKLRKDIKLIFYILL